MNRTEKYRMKRERLIKERVVLREILTDVLCDAEVNEAFDKLMGNPVELIDSWFGTKGNANEANRRR